MKSDFSLTDVFSAESEDNESYLERLQEYFTAYDIKDDTGNAAKRRAILLTWQWCLSSPKGFVIPGRAEYEDF